MLTCGVVGQATNWTLVVDATNNQPMKVFSVSSNSEVLQLISELASRLSGSFSLWPYGLSQGREHLLLGVECEYAFAQFGTSDLSDPRGFLWATASANVASSYVGFSVGGTLTEIPLHRCISVNTMSQICECYFATL
jgi:hypothetical protein